MTFTNKRLHERFPVALDVSFEFEGRRAQGRSRDISLGGMFIETPSPLPYGTSVVIEVKLPAMNSPAKLQATVRWSGREGMGVQFGTLRAKETWAINQLVRST